MRRRQNRSKPIFLEASVNLTLRSFARLPRASTAHDYGRGIYVGCLVVLGLATMVAIGSGSGYWAWCGTTFSLMCVGGTFDISTLRPDAY